MCKASSTWGEISCGRLQWYLYFIILLPVYLEVTYESCSQEPGKSSLHCRVYQPDQPKFGYLTNVCVAKYARRQGIASNMLLLAINAAKLNGKAVSYPRLSNPT